MLLEDYLAREKPGTNRLDTTERAQNQRLSVC
jgi:hypothetical protein